MITLADYPTIARLASAHTKARRLDLRAVRIIARQHPDELASATLTTAERALLARLLRPVIQHD